MGFVRAGRRGRGRAPAALVPAAFVAAAVVAACGGGHGADAVAPARVERTCRTQLAPRPASTFRQGPDGTTASAAPAPAVVAASMIVVDAEIPLPELAKVLESKVPKRLAEERD